MVASAAIGALGSIAANVIGGLASNANGVSNQKTLADYQAALNWKYAKKNALKMPGYQRRGFEAAGYNPMLALGSLGTSNSAWTTTGDPGNADFSNIGSNAIDTLNSIQAQDNQNKQTKATVQNTNADTILKQRQAETENFKQQNLEMDTMLKDAEQKLKNKDLKWYEFQRLRDFISTVNDTQRMLNDYQLGKIRNDIEQQNAVTNKQNALTNSTAVKNDYDIKKNTKTYSYSGGAFGFNGSESITGYGVGKHSFSINNPRRSNNGRKDYYNHNKIRHFNDPYGIGGYYD